MNAVALQTTVRDLVDEYDAKVAAVDDEIAAFKDAFLRLDRATTIQGTYAERVASEPYLHAEGLRKNLLKSGWKAVYERLQIDRIASAKDKQLFDRAIASPPPLTFENAKATFGDYFERPRFHILRGLAEAFCDLDPAYKSHSKVKIGVKGLPKRVILSGFGSFHSSYAENRFRDMLNALAAYQGKVPVEYAEIAAVREARGEIDMPERGIMVRKFANGNAHIFFDKWTLFDINKALAEFYGEVLADAEDEEAERRPGTAVAKDLQFYWSPPAVVEAALDYANVWSAQQYSGQRPEITVLEPSCGDGRILDAIRQRGYTSLGFEYHVGRANEARAKGHSVVAANFLEQVPEPIFDRVVMNPPFYGRHYVQHVRHAYKFLKPGGVLVSILPATAHYDHGELKGEWRDLPVASFAEAGTNVPTGLLRMTAPRSA